MACFSHLAAFRFKLEYRFELICPVLPPKAKEGETQKTKKERASRLGLSYHSTLRAL